MVNVSLEKNLNSRGCDKKKEALKQYFFANASTYLI